MLAGVYGMNFDHMPDLRWMWGYPLALATMVGLDIWIYLRFRKAKWI